MSRDVVVQLRSYLETIETAAPPTTIDELERTSGQLAVTVEEILRTDAPDLWESMAAAAEATPAEAETAEADGSDLVFLDLGELDEGTAPGARNRWTLLVAGVAAVIVLAVGVMIVVADGTGDDVSTGPASSSGATDPVPSGGVADPVAAPSVVDPVSGYRWTRVPYDEAVFGGPSDQTELGGVITGGPGLVAVGLAGSTYTGDAAVWTSADGFTWSRIPHDEAVFGHQDGGVIKMKSVTMNGSLLVAVGDQNKCCSYNVAAAVWTSADGITWSRIPQDDGVFDRAGMNSVTTGGPGLVAVGFEFLDQEHVIAVAWTSADAITWSRIPHDEAAFERAAMESVTTGGPGLVAVGGSHPDDDPPVAAVWTSADGVTWSRVPHDDAVFGGAGMNSVTAGGSGLVAVGWSDEREHTVAAVWTSPDGVTWSRVPHDDAVFGGAEMNSVTAGGPGLVAVGLERFDVAGEENLVAAVWTSPDGVIWSRVPHDETVFGGLRYQEMLGVTAGGPGLVAVGSANRDEGDFGEAVVWVATQEK